ncbi:KxYKxGKxW signal peptide domain-containing protein [Streptococcus suis]|nr:KxYKxGKxW signal peptide domain-containing protein [Streptococcus suis]
MFDKEKNQGRFRMWKSGKQWLYSGLIIYSIDWSRCCWGIWAYP